MATVKELLNRKGYEIWSVHPERSVFEAIREMADHNVGSLIVMEDDKLIGIFTERHYARNVFLKGKSSPKTAVREIMSTEVICVELEQTVDECMTIMTEKCVRHLPVFDQGRLVERRPVSS